jgi:hypothetical protein
MKLLAIIILLALASCSAPQHTTTFQQDLEASILDGFGPGAEMPSKTNLQACGGVLIPK